MQSESEFGTDAITSLVQV